SSSVLFFVPSHLQMLLSSPSFYQNSGSLRLVMTAGEALSVKLKSIFQEKTHSSTVLWNVYGPTETTVDVAFFPTEVERRNHGETGSVPIGRAFFNTENRVNDRGQY